MRRIRCEWCRKSLKGTEALWFSEVGEVSGNKVLYCSKKCYDDLKGYTVPCKVGGKPAMVEDDSVGYAAIALRGYEENTEHK